MPRVQSPTSGASERFAVSPGREESGYLHMPGGQSGHPLSPHYDDGHQDWESATTAVDEIRARFGPEAIGPASTIEGGEVRVVKRGAQQWGPDDRV